MLNDLLLFLFSLAPIWALVFNPCCCGCPFLTDDFNRADSSSMGASWTETAGVWDIASNTAVTGSASARLIGTTGTPDTTHAMRVRCDVTASNSGDQVRLILNHGNGGFHFAQVTFGTSGELKINSNQSVAVSLTPGTMYTFEACIAEPLDGSSQAAMYAKINGAKVGAMITPTAPFFDTANKAGVGTGPTMTGTATFDNFYAESTEQPTCPDCNEEFTCAHMLNGYAAEQYQVVITGVVNNSGPGACSAGECEATNATWICTQTGVGSCNFDSTQTLSCSSGFGSTGIRARFYRAGGDYYCGVNWNGGDMGEDGSGTDWDNPVSNTANWYKNLGATAPDGLTLDEDSFTIGAYYQCDITGSTCEVSAL